jgi:hypothetical protein
MAKKIEKMSVSWNSSIFFCWFRLSNKLIGLWVVGEVFFLPCLITETIFDAIDIFIIPSSISIKKLIIAPIGEVTVSRVQHCGFSSQRRALPVRGMCWLWPISTIYSRRGNPLSKAVVTLFA